MYDNCTRSIEHRIVSIHQPHVRPIVRGKAKAHTEFGAKINVSLIDGISFLDELSWDAFNEGDHLIQYVEKYKQRFGFYPAEILADKIYCSRNNRKLLKDLNIKLIAKPLGRPSTDPALSIHVSPGERNPIEGKFGQGKTGYGLDRIKARLKNTSESWIALIIMVLNLVKLAGVAAPSLLLNYMKIVFTFSAQYLKLWRMEFNQWDIYFSKQNAMPILNSSQTFVELCR
jgi:transposase, IS5 family